MSPIKVYLIFYGNWDKDSCGPRVLTSAVNSLSDARLDAVSGATTRSWWQVVTKYTQFDGQPVSGNVSVGAALYPGYPFGPSLATGQGKNSTWTVVTSLLAQGLLPVDPNGMYLILTSADVKVGNRQKGFCRGYCGFHTYYRYKGQTIKYGFTGDATKQCPGSVCNMNMGYGSNSPNRCYGADGMVSTLFHELAEIATDPTFWSWTAPKGSEVADVCAGQYMAGSKWGPGKKWLYNVDGSDGTKFLVQQVFDNDNNRCAHGP